MAETVTPPAQEVPDKPVYQCACLENIKGKLTEHHGEGSDVELMLNPTIDIESLTPGMSLPPLYYTYKAGKKRKKSYVTFNYCPFCGKSLKS